MFSVFKYSYVYVYCARRHVVYTRFEDDVYLQLWYFAACTRMWRVMCHAYVMGPTVDSSCRWMVNIVSHLVVLSEVTW